MKRLLLVLLTLLFWQANAYAIDCLAGTPSTVATVGAEQDLGYLNSRSVTFDRLQPQLDNTRIPMFGDSLTEAMDTYAINPLIVNMGINGGTMRDFFGRANRSLVSGSPISRRGGGCIWMLGINDTQYEYQTGSPQNPPYLIDLAAAWMTGKWIIVKILPVNEALYSGVTNAQIDAVNAHIQSVFGGRSGFVIVDAKSTLAPSGQLLAAYTIGDGLHLSAAGDAVIAASIQAAGVTNGMWAP